MNLKKFVSGVSAVAIAASAFVSMAVVANAEYTAQYERSLGTWSEADLSEWTASGKTASISDTDGLTTTTNNSAFTITKDVSSYINENDKVKITGTFFTGGPTGRNSSYGYLKIGDNIELRGNTQAQSSSFVINGTATDLDINARNHEFTFSVEVDTQLKQITSFMVDNTERLSSAQQLNSATINSIVMGHHRGGSGNYDTVYSLKAISIETEAQAAATTGSYVINYVYGDQTLKSVDGTTVAGLAPIINMDDFNVDNQKYGCSANDLGDKVVAADNTAENPLVVTVSCTPYAKVTEATVNYVVDGNTILTETAAVDGFEGDTVNVPFRHYIQIDGKLYVVAKNGGNPYYGDATVLTPETAITKTVTEVTMAEGETFVALVDGDGDSSNSADIRASNMSATRDDIELGDVTPGVYKIVYNQYIRGGEPVLYLDDEVVCELAKSTGSWGEAATEKIEITKAGKLVIKNVAMTDYVILYKTGDLTVEPDPAPVAPTATLAKLAAYDDATGHDGTASAWTFTVTPNDASGALSVTIGETTQTAETVLSSMEGSVMFGLVVKAADLDKAAVSAAVGETAVVID